MRIVYKKWDESFPPLVPIRPPISDTERALRRLKRPPAVASQCKPWIDANSYGVLIPFPYRAVVTVTGHADALPSISVESIAPRDITGYPTIVHVFAHGHFSIDTGYRIRTEQNVGIYVNDLPEGYKSPGALVRGLVETWWYPKRFFLVFPVPAPGEVVRFEYGDLLALLIPVVCERIVLEEANAGESEELARTQEEYDRYVRAPELRWTSVEGHGFTHAYKVFSKRRGQPRG